MRVTVKHVNGTTFEGLGESGGTVHLASPAEGGPSPMELMLMGAAGCSGIDIVDMLRKMRVEIKGFEISVEGNRAEDHPRVFTEIHLIYKFQGDNLPEDRLRRAIELSLDKYCSAINMLNKTAKVTYAVEIV